MGLAMGYGVLRFYWGRIELSCWYHRKLGGLEGGGFGQEAERFSISMRSELNHP